MSKDTRRYGVVGDFTLRGRSALVTSSTRGIGRTIALRLARAGATIAVNAQSRADCRPLVEEIEGFGGVAIPVPGAIETTAGCETMWRASTDQLGVVDILVNSGATDGHLALREEDREAMIWQANVLGPLRLVGFAAERGMRAPGGAILHIAAAPATATDPLLSVYRASQAALVSATRAVASTLVATGIRVNLIAADMGDRNVGQVLQGPRRTEIDARITPSQPAEEDDVVATALYLVSDVSAPTTGAVFSARTPFG